MSQAPIMPFFTDAYLADCHHLSTEAHGANLLLLLHLWRLGGKPLPDDDRILMPIVKAKNLRKWQQLKSELLPFFDVSDGTWRQKRLENTWADVMNKVAQNRENGKLGRAVQLSGRNPLKSQKTGAASASAVAMPSGSDPPGLSINHNQTNNQNHEPPDLSKEDEIMFTSTRAQSPTALTALEPILRDVNYFLPQGGCRISPALRPQVEQAAIECEAQLAAVNGERLMQIISRLMLHFPAPTGEVKERIAEDYAGLLQDFPEDLLCAAYQHVLKHHKYNSLPKIADFLVVMEPELARRKTTRRKLEQLLKQCEMEVAE